MNIPFIEVELTLLPKATGGRKHPLNLNSEKSFYRPHIVIGDASQREVPFKPNTNEIDEEYLCVQFRPCPLTMMQGDSATLIVDLLYYPSVDL